MKKKDDILVLLEKLHKKFESMESIRQSIRSVDISLIDYDLDIEQFHKNASEISESDAAAIADEVNSKLNFGRGYIYTKEDVLFIIKNSVISDRWLPYNAHFAEVIRSFRVYSDNHKSLAFDILPSPIRQIELACSVKETSYFDPKLNPGRKFIIEYTPETLRLSHSVANLICGISRIGTLFLVDFDEAIKLNGNREIISRFCKNIREYMLGIPQELKEFDSRSSYQVESALIEDFIVSFIIAHELSHLLNGEYVKSEGDSFIDKQKYMIHSYYHFEEINSNWTEEHLADLRAIDFMVRSRSREMFLALGVPLYLILVRFISSGGNKNCLSTRSETHPSTIDRFKIIQIFIFHLHLENGKTSDQYLTWYNSMNFAYKLFNYIKVIH